MIKKSSIIALFCFGFLLFYSEPAMAHNCSGLQDCYQQSKLAALAAALIALLLSLLLDFSPIGYWKGLLEAITGRDILTGDKLAWWQRALNLVPGGKGARTAAKAVDDVSDIAKAVNKVSDAAKVGEELGDTAKAAGKMGEAAKAVDEVGDAAKGVHSRYKDGTPVYKGEEPPRLGEAKPDPQAQGAHTLLRWDNINQRVYQGREFDGKGQPVRDIDFTSPTYPNGAPRPDHLPPPHQHRWLPNPTGGTPSRSKKPEPL
ncbi:MAG: hypothetical protein GPJ15_09745 [Microcystis aeruginosa G11-06]|jgi:hypothetical protein|nr:hypothetical protein [Microcystis aeruginosa LE13-04]NCS20264.1 hypothetical protein [Microcystis aeruginosa G11-06]